MAGVEDNDSATLTNVFNSQRHPIQMNRLESIAVNAPEIKKMAPVADVAGFPGVIGTFMGRDAISLAASYLGLKADDAVLLPAYLCEEVLRPFVGKTRVLFYDIREDLTVLPDEIRDKLKAAKVRLMILINYFGFLQPYREEIREICADNGTLLMEDCAHSLLTEGSGETGDLSVYSFRKILPVPDGGGLRVNVGGHVDALKFHPQVYSNLLSLLVIAKSVLKVRSNRLSRAGFAGPPQNLPSSSEPAGKHGRVLPLSSFASGAMKGLSFPRIIGARRNEYEVWQKITEQGGSVTPLFRDLPAGVCPMGFPVRAKNREALKSRARDTGIHLNIYWRLPSIVGREFGNSHKLAEEVLTLPVYPPLEPKKREELSKLVTCD